MSNLIWYGSGYTSPCGEWIDTGGGYTYIKEYKELKNHYYATFSGKRNKTGFLYLCLGYDNSYTIRLIKNYKFTKIKQFEDFIFKVITEVDNDPDTYKVIEFWKDLHICPVFVHISNAMHYVGDTYNGMLDNDLKGRNYLNWYNDKLVPRVQGVKKYYYLSSVECGKRTVGFYHHISDYGYTSGKIQAQDDYIIEDMLNYVKKFRKFSCLYRYNCKHTEKLSELLYKQQNLMTIDEWYYNKYTFLSQLDIWEYLMDLWWVQYSKGI